MGEQGHPLDDMVRAWRTLVDVPLDHPTHDELVHSLSSWAVCRNSVD